ncbi:hypothetical protein G6F65_014285 [Rhizopus arrhizus]|nr:hypothetical protein G6F65_014285 [Rhizopus arrhizus]
MVLATIYEGIDEAAAEHGYLTFVSNTQDEPDKQRKLIDMALARRVDGLILGDAHSAPANATPNPLLAELARRDVPFVLVSRHADHHCAVTCDDLEGGRLAAKHLLDMGHRRIAVMVGEPFASTGRDRSEGFFAYCAQHGVEVPAHWRIESPFDTDAGRDIGARLLSPADRPTAIFAVNDFLAVGVMGAARDQGLEAGRGGARGGGGAADDYTVGVMRRIYEPFQRTNDRLMVMDVRSAELTKYAANAMLATRISFMNEMANLAEALGADIEQVRRGIGADPRIGYHFLYPGAGYGGSCFPKDVQALVNTAAENSLPMRVIEAAEAANHAQKFRLSEKLVQRYGEDLRGRKIALWGLSFKPNTDDMREAPSLTVIAELTRRGADVRAYDPVAMHEAARVLVGQPGISFATDMYDALDGADALLIATEWKVFRAPDFDRVKALLKTPLIIDGRNLYTPADVRGLGFEYSGIGRA